MFWQSMESLAANSKSTFRMYLVSTDRPYVMSDFPFHMSLLMGGGFTRELNWFCFRATDISLSFITFVSFNLDNATHVQPSQSIFLIDRFVTNNWPQEIEVGTIWKRSFSCWMPEDRLLPSSLFSIYLISNLLFRWLFDCVCEYFQIIQVCQK